MQAKYPDIMNHIQEIVDGNTYGSPEKVLSWTTLSLHDIQNILTEKYQISVSYRTVSDLLEKLGYSKQTNQKMLQAGKPNPNAQFAERAKLEIHISHFPPGTSKWNKVEHRLFCFITKNWQGQPLADIQTAVNLIGSTSTEKGLKVICKADYNNYELAKKGSDDEYQSISISRIMPFGEWNYVIK